MGDILSMSPMMTELTTANSFIVRIYRVDTENPHKLTGLVEAMDGSGVRAPFTNLDELAVLLRCLPAERSVRKRRTKQDANP